MLEGNLWLPKRLVRNPSGFSLDIGGSLMKVVYYTTRDQNEGKECKDVEINMESFPLERVEEALTKLKGILGSNLQRKVACCGLGCMGSKEILNKFGIEFETTSEMDCFVKAFCFLSKNVHPEAWMDDKPSSSLEFSEKQFQNILTILQSTNPSEMPKNMPTSSGNKMSSPKFPCLLVILGSGGAFIKVQEDGTYSIVQGHNRAGRTFLGMASLLIRTSDFLEIMSLASRGTHKAIDSVTDDYRSSGPTKDDLYAKTMPAEGLFFAFGKAVGKERDDFSREDLARTLMVTTCCDLAQVAYLTAKAHGLRDIYLSGSFVSHELVQYELSRFLQLRILCNPQDDLDFHLLKNPGCYGALGALIQDNMEADFSHVDAVSSTYSLQFLGVLAT